MSGAFYPEKQKVIIYYERAYDKREDRKRDETPQANNNDNTEKAL